MRRSRLSSGAIARGGVADDSDFLFFKQLLSADQATFDITSIPDGYSAIVLELYLRSDYNGGSFDSVGIRFNGDTGVNHHAYHFWGGTGSLGTSMQYQCSCAGSGANDFSQIDAKIFRYADLTGYKTLTGSSYHLRDNAGTTFAEVVGGAWFSTAALNRITVLPISGANWKAGSACQARLLA